MRVVTTWDKQNYDNMKYMPPRKMKCATDDLGNLGIGLLVVTKENGFLELQSFLEHDYFFIN